MTLSVRLEDCLVDSLRVLLVESREVKLSLFSLLFIYTIVILVIGAFISFTIYLIAKYKQRSSKSLK